MAPKKIIPQAQAPVAAGDASLSVFESGQQHYRMLPTEKLLRPMAEKGVASAAESSQLSIQDLLDKAAANHPNAPFFCVEENVPVGQKESLPLSQWKTWTFGQV